MRDPKIRTAPYCIPCLRRGTTALTRPAATRILHPIVRRPQQIQALDGSAPAGRTLEQVKAEIRTYGLRDEE